MKNTKEAEQIEADLLIEKGIYLQVGSRRKIHIKPLTTETMLYCNNIATKIDNNFKETNSIGDYLSTMNEEIILKSEFIACAYLHTGWKIKMFKKIVAYWLRTKLTSKTITNLVLAIVQMYDLENFTISTHLLLHNRATKPKTNRVERNS